MNRARLAVQQAELLRALLDGGAVPPGFDAERIAVQAVALRAKRFRVLVGLRPELAEFPEQFEEYAGTHPRTAGGRARADAEEFAAWLISRGDLPAPRRRWWRWAGR